jgi:hypothetical protein
MLDARRVHLDGNPAYVSFIPEMDMQCVDSSISVMTTSDEDPITVNAYYSLGVPNPAMLYINGNISSNSSSIYLTASAIVPSYRFSCLLNLLLSAEVYHSAPFSSHFNIPTVI